MSTDTRPTAKIYEFRRRVPANVGIANRQVLATADRQPLAMSNVDCGSGWYHEAAIQAERPHKS
jgi:hypothetical protein